MTYRILITGSRDWADAGLIMEALDEFAGAEDVVLVSGACPSGADIMCEAYAKCLGWRIETHPANWSLYGRRAGFIRNSEMVNLGADVCLAFIKNDSNGATNTAHLARTAGIQTYVYNERDNYYGKPRNEDCE